jgi:hypothetical protein
VGGFIERGPGELVAAAADFALDVGLARLVARRGLSVFPCAGGGLNITPQWLL